MYLVQTSKHITTKPKGQHKNPWQRRESKPGPIATQSDALPLDHRYRLKSSCLTVDLRKGPSIQSANANVKANAVFRLIIPAP